MTLGQVAKRAGVAVDTARKALRGDPSVRFYLRERVEKAARELDYEPNLVARALRNKSLNLVPISSLDLDQPYFGSLTARLSQCLVDAGMEPAIYFDPNHLMRIRRSLSTNASILVVGFDEKMVRALSRRQKVVTIQSRLPAIPNVADVAIDFDSAYRHAVRTVLASGRHRVGVCSWYYAVCQEKGWHEPKVNAIFRNLREAGLEPVGPADNPFFASPAAVLAWLKDHPRSIDALFCGNDIEASHLYGALASRGIRIPRDILIVGCDANCMLTGTWSLKLDTAIIASDAVNLLSRLLGGASSVEQPVYRPVLVDHQGRMVETETAGKGSRA